MGVTSHKRLSLRFKTSITVKHLFGLSALHDEVHIRRHATHLTKTLSKSTIPQQRLGEALCMPVIRYCDWLLHCCIYSYGNSQGVTLVTPVPGTTSSPSLCWLLVCEEGSDIALHAGTNKAAGNIMMHEGQIGAHTYSTVL